jgi:hypothetical protein
MPAPQDDQITSELLVDLHSLAGQAARILHYLSQMPASISGSDVELAARVGGVSAQQTALVRRSLLRTRLAVENGFAMRIVAHSDRLARFARLLPVENASAIYANKALKFGKVRTVGDKTAGLRLFDVRVHCRDGMASRQRDELIRPTYKEDVTAYQDRASMPLDQGQEGSLDLACAARIQHHKVYAKSICRRLHLSCFGGGKTRVGRVDKECDRSFCRLELMQQFEAMCGRYSLLLGYARDVSFRTAEACDKANRDRIAADGEDDWNAESRNAAHNPRLPDRSIFNTRYMLLAASDSLELLLVQFDVTALTGLGQVVGGRDFRVLLVRLDLTLDVLAHKLAPCCEARAFPLPEQRPSRYTGGSFSNLMAPSELEQSQPHRKAFRGRAAVSIMNRPVRPVMQKRNLGGMASFNYGRAQVALPTPVRAPHPSASEEETDLGCFGDSRSRSCCAFVLVDFSFSLYAA